ncbi:hypothetical protein INT46_000486 [Mucor plumbeus]|uniref:Uncharacterized protein n=1 Tax=Mucor plumbeus TaxID=97098 RepID=A0A8H7QDB6_9FUNG|nr:hypothetical protein INT46_000486 [Mucor plumbeus]
MPTKNTSFKRRLIREPDDEELEVEIEKQQVVNLSGIQTNTENIILYPISIATLSEEAPKKNAFIPASSSSAHATQAGPSITVTEFDIAIEAMTKKIGLQAEENEDSIFSLLQSSVTFHRECPIHPSSKSDKKKILEVLIDIEAVNQYKRDQTYLYDFQSECRKKYGHDLVYDQVQTNADRAIRCVICDSYKSGVFIRILKNLWVSESETGLPKVLSISFLSLYAAL